MAGSAIGLISGWPFCGVVAGAALRVDGLSFDEVEWVDAILTPLLSDQ
jgi:hypothetical protein